jgi:predicted Zn-ribbon and HTH transcriptional regulator
MSKKVVVEQRTCKRCGHVWIPSQVILPIVCPKCKSPYWNKEKKQAGVNKNAKTVM